MPINKHIGTHWFMYMCPVAICLCEYVHVCRHGFMYTRNMHVRMHAALYSMSVNLTSSHVLSRYFTVTMKVKLGQPYAR
jgi:hypothetical protein